MRRSPGTILAKYQGPNTRPASIQHREQAQHAPFAGWSITQTFNAMEGYGSECMTTCTHAAGHPMLCAVPHRCCAAAVLCWLCCLVVLECTAVPASARNNCPGPALMGAPSCWQQYNVPLSWRQDTVLFNQQQNCTAQLASVHCTALLAAVLYRSAVQATRGLGGHGGPKMALHCGLHCGLDCGQDAHLGQGP
jgi:hypothetical protein